MSEAAENPKKASAMDRIGEVVENRFEIEKHIGTGGMATVYRAKHQQVDLNVAIKILNRDEMNEKDIERLKREAKVLNSIFHPNVVKVYSFGFLESGEPYLVLDLLDGKSLDQMIQAEKILPIVWLLHAFDQICEGLICAHDSGLVHHDLKPSNIMVVKTDEDGAFIKLLDFGIARSLVTAPNEQKLTRHGEIFGSPLYMSPEAIQGKEMDHRSDIYALGCLMYESITGAPPFLGNNVIMTFMKHMTEKPKPMSEMTPGLHVDPRLEKIVDRCMEKDPEARYQSVSEVHRELKEIMAKH